MALALLLFLTAGVATAARADPPYTERVRLIETLAIRYPGAIEPRAALGKYGLWAGILTQTRWQQASGRDGIPLWSLINYALSVEPSIYAAELQRAGSKGAPQEVCAASSYLRAQPTAAAAGSPVKPTDVCEAWMRYFIAARRQLPATKLLSLLWHAHTAAIVYGLHAHRDELEHARTTTLERNFWASWAELVFVLEAARFPTDATTSTRVSAFLMPPCSPIGSTGCSLRLRDLGRSLAFVSTLASRRGSIDRILAMYERVRAKPLVLTTLAVTDPALAGALRLYLRIAGRAR